MSKKTSNTTLTTEDGWSIPEDEQKNAAVVYPLPFLSLCNKGKNS